jgi:glycosyltransferase involved in cell wall biosynthesis
MGGAEIFCVALCNELSEMGVDVLLAVFFADQRAAEQNVGLDDRVRVFGLGKAPGLDVGLVLRVARLLKSERPDVVNTHLRALYYVLPGAAFLGDTYFHTIHNLADKEEPSSLIRKIKRACFQRGWIRAITISKSVDDSFVALYGNAPRYFLENGALMPAKSEAFGEVKDLIDGLRCSPATLVFVSVGTIKPQKNQILLVDAFSDLYRSGADVVLLLIGGEPGSGSGLMQHLESAKAPNTVLLGSRSNVGDYLRLADAFCLSSLYEGMPIALLEALSLGVVPICTPVGGMSDVLTENGIGYLSRDLTTKSYVQTLREFCALDFGDRRAMSGKCQAVFRKRYGMRAVATRYLEAYCKAVGEGV